MILYSHPPDRTPERGLILARCGPERSPWLTIKPFENVARNECEGVKNGLSGGNSGSWLGVNNERSAYLSQCTNIVLTFVLKRA